MVLKLHHAHRTQESQIDWRYTLFSAQGDLSGEVPFVKFEWLFQEPTEKKQSWIITYRFIKDNTKLDIFFQRFLPEWRQNYGWLWHGSVWGPESGEGEPCLHLEETDLLQPHQSVRVLHRVNQLSVSVHRGAVLVVGAILHRGLWRVKYFSHNVVLLTNINYSQSTTVCYIKFFSTIEHHFYGEFFIIGVKNGVE